MLLSATLSKPVKNISEILEKDYQRIKIRLSASSDSKPVYVAELYTEKQVFHKKFTEEETLAFLEQNCPKAFKNCVQRTETEEITILTNKKGQTTKLVKKLNSPTASGTGAAPEGVAKGNEGESRNSGRPGPEQSGGRRPLPLEKLLSGASNRKKNYVLKEGIPVPFLVRLGIMTAEGKVIASKYDKFRQINRFLETFADVLPQIRGQNPDKKISVVDFGSGKSYLTFAVHYYLTEIEKTDCEIFGLDLKKDVIEYCARLADELNLKGISFAVGDIASFGQDRHPDVIITLHACDTATDFALDYGIRHQAKAILSVPCCQHEINLQLKKTSAEPDSIFAPLLKYGLIKERFSALITDALRGEILENAGYKVQMLEFIDDEGTPKNLMIRAVKTSLSGENKRAPSKKDALLKELKISQKLWDLQDSE